MALQIDVMVDPAASSRPPPGSPVHVELRDTSLADAAARVLCQAESVVGEPCAPRLASVTLPEAGPSPGTTVWAHVDVGRDGRVSVGDYITMQSYPVPSAELRPARLAVTVKPVR